MNRFSKPGNLPMAFLAVVLFTLFLLSSAGAATPAKEATAPAGLNIEKMSDMSDYDPGNPVIPTGDTIKIAVVGSFSGPASVNGQFYFNAAQWTAHAINKAGGIWVDGKKKLIEVIKADHMSKADQCKKVCERMILQEKVHALVGTDGSHMMKIINETAGKYKIISLCFAANSDELQDATNFSRYAFMTAFSTTQIGRGLAYYYGQIRKKEKKFYVLCQDYSYGRGLADGFKKGMKEYYPEAQIVGEDYHKLFLTDYAPYLTKIKASGAEVVFTGDWVPDAANLLKQARQLGLKLPFANLYMDEPNMLNEIGVEGTKGLVNITQYGSTNPTFKTDAQKRYAQVWHKLWQTKWKAPYNTLLYQYPVGNMGSFIDQIGWMFSVMERAKSTDPEKMIAIWEGDSYRFMNGKSVKMRACDHKIIENFHVYEYVTPDQQKQSMNIPPYYWYKTASGAGPSFTIPTAKVLPWMDQKLDRCKGKNDWGD